MTAAANNKLRRSLLYIALVGVAAWSGWLAINEPRREGEADVADVAEPAVRALPTAPPTRNAAVAPKKQEEAEPRLGLARGNLFPEQTWFVAPPPPPPPPYVPPPPPQAPPLPFSYMGRWQEAGQTTYYLTRGSLPVSVRAGQVLDGAWRLEPVTGDVLNFTYLPLNQTRSLRTGD